MPPKKKTQRKQSKGKQQKPQKKLSHKKTIPIQEDSSQTYLDLIAKYLDEESKKKQTKQEKKDQDSCQEINQIQQHRPKICFEDEGEHQCIVCQDSAFEQGKYILGCRHILCHQCYVYWADIQQLCPACFQESVSVQIVHNGITKLAAIKHKYRLPRCQICETNNNEDQMYYCDGCESKVIHIYCNPYLLKKDPKEKWYCKPCRQKQRDIKPRKPKRGKSLYQMDLDSFLTNFE